MTTAEIFEVSSQLKGTRISKEEWESRLEKAGQLIERLALNYHLVVSDLLGQEIKRFRSSRTQDRLAIDAVKPLFTAAHDIRGLAGSFGYDVLGAVASSLADFIDEHDDISDAKQMEVLNLHLDAMLLIANKQMKGDGGEAGRALLQQLSKAVQAVG